jgi:hypothetical protein
MERLVDLYIKEGPLEDYLLNPMQHAYLKGKSTETALHSLVYKIDGLDGWIVSGGVALLHVGHHKTGLMCTTVYL